MPTASILVELAGPVAWLANYTDLDFRPNVYVTTHHELAVENCTIGEPIPLVPASEITRLSAELEALRVDAERLKVALRFYANSDHYLLDSDEEFDSVSGEPQNWLCSGRKDSATMIEDGEVARCALRGKAISWIDGGEDSTPKPIPGEMGAAMAAGEPT